MAEPILVARTPMSKNREGAFRSIDERALNAVDYICRHRASDENFSPEVVVSYNREGELKFERC